ncbi:MAG: undecaprenyldiphospho-muramoylpentapeptide beta-N-acetylglucosaminyltransferase [Rikenellaceae bacterium]
MTVALKKETIRIVVSGGGTAGHIYPAIAVVEAIEKRLGKENCQVLFIGVEGKMECNIVPNYDYQFETLKVSGLIRKPTLKNIAIATNIALSVFKARKLIKKFKPDAVIGFGGYVSAPVIFASLAVKTKRYIWEGNSFAGLSNRLVKDIVDDVFVSFPNMEKFFPESNIIESGSPIRGNMSIGERKGEAALQKYGFNSMQKVILITGGSLGARQINEAFLANIDKVIEDKSVGVIWQTGKLYYEEMLERVEGKECSNITILPFLDDISSAYSITDTIICRSGSSTVAEVARCEIAALFVPSSGVTDDHQTKNALSVVESGGAEMISDSEAIEKMVPMALALVKDDQKRSAMIKILKRFAHNDAADVIANKLIMNN